jgi:tRNA wybutosine-synthesizing protein 3
MLHDNFLQQKQDILSKNDKSNIGRWDEKIKKLCDKINHKENYYTTSSCSGRIIVMIEQEKKAPDLFKFVSHNLVDSETFLKYLSKETAKLDLKFKQEPCIIHVSCKTLKDAQIFLDKAKLSGWKNSGIIATEKRFVVEISGTEKLEFPLTKNGKILVDDVFLKIVLKKCNENLKKSWERINKLEKII